MGDFMKTDTRPHAVLGAVKEARLDEGITDSNNGSKKGNQPRT